MSFLSRILAGAGSFLFEKAVRWFYSRVVKWNELRAAKAKNKEAIEKLKNSQGETPEERKAKVDEALDDILDDTFS